MPFKILGSAFMSEIAASMAGFAALPMTELKVKTAPMFTTEGFWQQIGPVNWNSHIKVYSNSGRATKLTIQAGLIHKIPSNFKGFVVNEWMSVEFKNQLLKKQEHWLKKGYPCNRVYATCTTWKKKRQRKKKRKNNGQQKLKKKLHVIHYNNFDHRNFGRRLVKWSQCQKLIPVI